MRRHSAMDASQGALDCIATSASSCNDTVFPAGKPPSFLGDRPMAHTGPGSSTGAAFPSHASMSSSAVSQSRVRSAKAVQLVPIDHGLILPHFLALDDVACVWLHWPQCKQPLSKANAAVRALYTHCSRHCFLDVSAYMTCANHALFAVAC